MSCAAMVINLLCLTRSLPTELQYCTREAKSPSAVTAYCALYVLICAGRTTCKQMYVQQGASVNEKHFKVCLIICFILLVHFVPWISVCVCCIGGCTKKIGCLQQVLTEHGILLKNKARFTRHGSKTWIKYFVQR